MILNPDNFDNNDNKKTMHIENIILVTAKTRLQRLIARFNTLENARFYLNQKGQAESLDDLIREDSAIKNTLQNIQNQVSDLARVKLVEKSFLPNFIFTEKDLILAVGQDGLVANIAKYAAGTPIIGINPAPDRYDGILLPFHSQNYLPTVNKIIKAGSYNMQSVSMAKVELDDGQRLLAFNDLFIGPKTHSSARYKLHYRGQVEQQSSSGLIVSTGAGSTGWMSSIFNMANGMLQTFNDNVVNGRPDYLPAYQIPWDAQHLLFAVREPFLSRTSQIKIVAGAINKRQNLVIESQMSENGVIFSDGIQEDFIQFTAGRKATIGLAAEQARIVVN